MAWHSELKKGRSCPALSPNCRRRFRCVTASGHQGARERGCKTGLCCDRAGDPHDVNTVLFIVLFGPAAWPFDDRRPRLVHVDRRRGPWRRRTRFAAGSVDALLDPSSLRGGHDPSIRGARPSAPRSQGPLKATLVRTVHAVQPRIRGRVKIRLNVNKLPRANLNDRVIVSSLTATPPVL